MHACVCPQSIVCVCVCVCVCVMCACVMCACVMCACVVTSQNVYLLAHSILLLQFVSPNICPSIRDFLTKKFGSISEEFPPNMSQNSQAH